MNEETIMAGETWGEREKRRKEMRATMLKKRTEELMELQSREFDIRRITPQHYRVNGRLDIWPEQNRWYDIKNFRRGYFSQIGYFVKHYFEKNG